MTAAAPSPFAGAAPYYRFRAPYAEAALDFACAELGVGPGSRVLDVGCGPGTLAIRFAARAREVVGVDVDAEMLAEAERAARRAGRGNVRFLRARAEELPGELGRFRAATLGRSFHWMDRDLVLRRLAELLEPGGGVALFATGVRATDESWMRWARPIAERYLGPHGRHPAMNAELENEPALRRAGAFAPPDERAFPLAVERDFDSLLGCIYSHSSSTRRRFGERAPEFERELRAAFAERCPSGLLREPAETQLVIARKLERRP
jgi:SAM-dependent methyltransferase